MSSPLPTFLQQLEACNLPHALSTYFGPAGMGFPALRWRLDDHFVLMLMMGMLGLSAHCLLHTDSAHRRFETASVFTGASAKVTQTCMTPRFSSHHTLRKHLHTCHHSCTCTIPQSYTVHCFLQESGPSRLYLPVASVLLHVCPHTISWVHCHRLVTSPFLPLWPPSA